MQGMEDLLMVKFTNTIPLDIKTRKRMHFKYLKELTLKNVGGRRDYTKYTEVYHFYLSM